MKRLDDTIFSGVTYMSLTSPRSMLPYTAATSSLELRLVSDAARTPRAVRDSTWSWMSDSSGDTTSVRPLSDSSAGSW